MTEAISMSLRNINSSDLVPSTVLLIHTLSIYQLGGLADWFTSLGPNSRPRLILQFQFPLEFGVFPPSELPRAAVLARQAADALTAVGSVRFATNSLLLKEHLSSQLGQPFILMPVPTRWPDLQRPISRLPGVIFGFFGGLRAEKGAALLAETIPAFVHRYPETRFIIHAPARGKESNLLVAQSLGRIPQVELINSPFKVKDEYFSHFCKAGCILLPYSPTEYALRTSGIFIEALGLGRLVITTNGTWMAEELQHWPEAGFTMPHYDAKDFYDCLEMARNVLNVSSLDPLPNKEVVSRNSAPSFCAALMNAVDD